MPGAQNAGEAHNEVILVNAKLAEQGGVSRAWRKSIGIHPVGHYDTFALRHSDRFQIVLERSRDHDGVGCIAAYPALHPRSEFSKCEAFIGLDASFLGQGGIDLQKNWDAAHPPCQDRSRV